MSKSTKEIFVVYVTCMSCVELMYAYEKKEDAEAKWFELNRKWVNEDSFDESKFDSELLDDNNWSVNDNGKIVGIYIPAIYEDGEISFRYR